MLGEVFYFLIYVSQQLGVMLGVGAQTVLLCAHLLAVHHGERDNPHANYAEAARFALGVGFFLMILSGLAAVALHTLAGQLDTVLAPAFLFKWALIAVLLAAFVLRGRMSERVNLYYAFTGATWYALFLVHSLGPITSWGTLWTLYILWGALFSAVWAAFVALMRSGIKRPAVAPPPPQPRPTPPPKPVVHRVPWWHRLLVWLSAPKKKPVVLVASPPQQPVPLPRPVPQPPPPPPALRPVPLPPPPPPAPPKATQGTAPPPLPSVALAKEGPKPAPFQQPSTVQEVIDHVLVPALRIMPQRPEDIGRHNRPPVVKPDARSGPDRSVGVKI